MADDIELDDFVTDALDEDAADEDAADRETNLFQPIDASETGGRKYPATTTRPPAVIHR